MRLSTFSFGLCAICFTLFSSVSGSVFLPYNKAAVQHGMSSSSSSYVKKSDFALRNRRHSNNRNPMTSAKNLVAMSIPGNSMAEQVFVGGFGNFLQIYNLVITARILLSWFPQAQGIGALQPVFAITDPFLNFFRGVIPPIFGLDFSPIIGFFLLNALTSATAALGVEPEKTNNNNNKSSLMKMKEYQLK